MSNNPHEIFKAPKDYESWASYILQCDLIGALSDEEKRQAKRSLVYLCGVLGDDFLSRAVNIRHPLAFPVMMATAWTRLWLIDFANALAALDNSENFQVILSKIRPDNQNEAASKQFSEGVSVLEAAYRFSEAGFGIAFDQKEFVTLLNGKRHEKKPDLKITDGETGEILFAEVSNLEMSE